MTETTLPCGACGEPATHRITLHGKRVPACLRHTNVWRTPAPDYTCPTECVEGNHPGMEHAEWLDQIDLWYPDDDDPPLAAPASADDAGRAGGMVDTYEGDIR